MGEVGGSKDVQAQGCMVQHGEIQPIFVITVIFKNCILKSFKKWFLDIGGTPTLSNDLKDAYLGP